MPLSEREQQNQRTFDQLAASYDRLGFLTQSALYFAEQVEVNSGDRVLDIMCGTGTVALALAPKVGVSGQVVGSDLSAEMVAVAQAKAAQQKVTPVSQVSFVQGNAAQLPFADATFDKVVCAAGLFFMPDMVAALAEWRRVLRPGGQVVYSSFGRGLMGDLPALWRECLGRYGFKAGSPPLGRIPTLDAAQDLLRQAGFTAVSAELTPVPYTLVSTQARWDDIAAGLEGQPLAGLAPEQREAIQAEHLAELAPLFEAGPLTVPLPVLVARGVKG